jgi:hypothetical protein
VIRIEQRATSSRAGVGAGVGPAGAARHCGFDTTGLTKHFDSAQCPESKDELSTTMASSVAGIPMVGGIGSVFESSITPTACRTLNTLDADDFDDDYDEEDDYAGDAYEDGGDFILHAIRC